MKIRLPRPSGYFLAATVAVAGVLTGAVIAGIKAGTLVVLVFAGLLYALIWEGGLRASDAVQKRIGKRRGG